MMKLDLSGLWQVYLDGEKTPALPAAYPEEMYLPGTTSAAGLGPENPARETYFLTDAHKFEGYAWFRRSFTAAGWQGRQTLLTLERTRKTRVWLDGAEVQGLAPADHDSLSTPHRYLLPAVSEGEHELVICVDNTDYPTRGGHLTSPDTQSNWNGITGEISLTVAESIAEGLRVIPMGCTLRVVADVLGVQPAYAEVLLPGQQPQRVAVKDGRIDGVCALTGQEALWDEFSPALHTLTLRLGNDEYTRTFGLRVFHNEGRILLCNGREVFLRGKHDGLIFPRTGYAPTDVDSWRQVMQTAKDHGINHYRFHTCCPPEAAFRAADELGIVLSPELPFWGTVADEGEEGYDARERAFLIGEGFRILREFGHHPSFVFLSMGNELWGSKPALNRMLADYRAYDPGKLYVSGANNFQWVPEVLAEEDVFVGVRLSGERLIRGSYAMCDAPQGIVQTTAPESVTNYDAMVAPKVEGGAAGQSGKVLIQYGTGVKEVDAEAAEAMIPEVPVITHEVGQYQFYPDFDEIDQYTGPLKARNFEVFRERLTEAGLWQEHERFFRCAGQLAVDCYRREIETALRSGEIAGFQLLDLQDFSGQGTALVGVLNAFMESKGLIAPEKWRQFCASTVVLGLLDTFVYQSGDALCFSVQISECDPAKRHSAVTCQLWAGETLLGQETVPVKATERRLSAPVRVELGTLSAESTTRLTLRLLLEDGTCNEYPLWVFPKVEVSITREGIALGGKRIAFVASAEEAAGSTVPAVVVPPAEGKLPAAYASDFWCYPMFRSISESMGRPLPIGTLGLCIAAEHPWLHGFTKEEYTTPAWYGILQTAHCENVPCAEPVVQMIDNTERCQRLCLLWQQEGVAYLTARLWENAQDPAVRAFAASLAEGLCKEK
ncbi:MAG: hypothetical protein E7320_06245 [Clostridiales bacterium]|nr:hypothetical protein [Clostridiales bacterium]